MQSLTRRTVLAAATAAPFAASAQPTPPIPARATGRPAPEATKGKPLPDSERLGWAVVGLGDFATNEAIPAFEDSRMAKLTGFVSGNPGKLQDYGRRHGVKSLFSYTDFDRIRQDPGIDVVYIILPNALHADFAVRALEAGKHVFCEKPMAVTPADCERMIAAAKRAGKQLGIAYRAHFEPHNEEALRRLRAGELGTLRYITSDHGRILDPSKPADQWRAQKSLAGGGSLYDIGIYSLNGACMFAGADPVEVTGWIDTPKNDPRFEEIEDVVSFRLRFPSGLIAACSSAYSIAGVKRIQLFGSKATARLDPATDYYRNRLMIETDQKTDEPSVEQASEQFAGEIDGFCEAIRANRPHRTPGEMGLRDVRIMQAIYRSAGENKPVRV